MIYEFDESDYVSAAGGGCAAVVWLWWRRRPHSTSFVQRLLVNPGARSTSQQLRRFPWRNLIELGLIVAWAVWVGQAYLDPNPVYWPYGAEVSVTMQSHFPWTALPKCGMCALWNGWINGGSPTLADVYSAVAHPVAIGAVMAFGLIHGAKFILLVSLIAAGVAQWWLAKVMGLSWLPRLWVAAMAVVGGHLAGRLQQGLVIFVFSAASISLLLAPAIQLVETGRRRTSIVLGVLTGLALLAGQGYLQVALIFAWLPALLVFAVRATNPRFPWKEFALAGLIAVLVAAILWVPMAHFWPNVAKDYDLGMRSVQPLQYLPLNLVINDYTFYDTTALSKTTTIGLYVNYIGWAPVLLAIASVALAPRARRRLHLFFSARVGVGVLPRQWLADHYPARCVPYIPDRHTFPVVHCQRCCAAGPGPSGLGSRFAAQGQLVVVPWKAVC